MHPVAGGRCARAPDAAAALVLVCCMTAVPAVHGADIRVLCPPALRTPIVESARAFARSTHHRVEFIFAAVAAVHKRVATGEHADVAISTVQGADALVRLG